MKLLLRRRYLKETYTIGDLYAGDVFVCNTLEDRVRDLSREPKVPGQTAIPSGTYRVILSVSARFGRTLPEILGVPFFTGVRIHGGNSAADTDGCVLTGKNNIPGRVTDSQLYLSRLMALMAGVPDITITVDNPA